MNQCHFDVIAVVMADVGFWRGCGSDGNVRSFIPLAQGEGITSFEKSSHACFSGEIKAFSGVYFFRIH